uniref:Uncharacterized protein n=1 Tax=Piliocolobus tephrosceles TaxID=591936 RepID=A0A8C9HNW9_9PRIM
IHGSFQSRGLRTAVQAAQMDVSFLSLLGDGFAGSLPAFGYSLAAMGLRTPFLGDSTAPVRHSGSWSSCAWCSAVAGCIWSSWNCLMMASRSS